jgi:hypothetical protein
LNAITLIHPFFSLTQREISDLNSQLLTQSEENRKLLDSKHIETSTGQATIQVFSPLGRALRFNSLQSEIEDRLSRANQQIVDLSNQLNDKHQECTAAQVALQVGLALFRQLLIIAF